MIKSIKLLISLTLLALLNFGCDEGLKPKPDQVSFTGFSGTIRFVNWPTPDSLLDLRIVAFRTFPPQGIIADVLAGRAVVYPALGDSSLPFFVDSIHYAVPSPAGRFEYIVLAQQFGPNILADWRPAGQYDLDTNLAVPSPIEIIEGKETRNVDINVDFRNLPPPPPVN